MINSCSLTVSITLITFVVIAFLLVSSGIAFFSFTDSSSISIGCILIRSVDMPAFGIEICSILWVTTDLKFHLELVFDFSNFLWLSLAPGISLKPESNCVYIFSIYN